MKMTEKVPKHFGYGNITRVLYIDLNELGKKYTWENIIDLVIQSYNATQ